MRWINRGMLWLIVMAILGGIFLIPTVHSHVAHLFAMQSISQLTKYVHSLGAWGPFVSMILMILHSVTFVPAEVITIGNIMVFGPVWGVLYSWFGAMLGAYLSYFLARTFGHPLVQSFVSARVLERFDAFMENRGVTGVLILRLIPLVSFNALNYACGLTKMTFWNFTWTTGLGILPMEILIAVAYKSATAEKFGIFGLTGFGVIWLVGLFIQSKVRSKNANGKITNH